MKALQFQIGGCLLLLFVLCFPMSIAQHTDTLSPPRSTMIDGQVLFAPMMSRTTYLIDRSGNVNHTWASDYLPGEGVRWLGDGAILRTIKVDAWDAGGAGGGVQIVQADGTVTWDYRYDSATHLSHHDVLMLPNGDVLMIAWEVKTYDEAINAGRNPNYLFGNEFWPDEIIEVKPTGPTSGTIVWEWHAWDHLIQDYDASKQNYGVVANHPELIDLNYCQGTPDWLHVNSIDYNQQFDQILISVHNYNEVWVIDHSTTTEQAAGHTGGRFGHGGDLLYRWGNPQAYRAGTSADKVFQGQHDATWIRSGCPGAGDILVLNNGISRGYSSVDEFVPPVDTYGDYYRDPGTSFGPDSLTWSYTATPPVSFYTNYIGGAERLSDGDTLICDGANGRFFEVTPDNTMVWQYYNLYPMGGEKDTFKIVFIPSTPPETNYPDLDCSGSLSWTKVQPGATVTGSFTVQNIGGSGSLLNWTVNASSLTWGTWTFTPSSGENLTPEDGSVTVQVSVVAPDNAKQTFQGYLRVENQQNASDFANIPVTLTTPLNEAGNSQHQAASYLSLRTPFSFFFRQYIQEILAAPRDMVKGMILTLFRNPSTHHRL